jgi:hypothetical protein
MPSAEDRMPPHPRGTVEMFRARGHTVTVRESRGGSLRYTLDGERERTALALSNRWHKLYEGQLSPPLGGPHISRHESAVLGTDVASQNPLPYPRPVR